jgi:hypothetical protein
MGERCMSKDLKAYNIFDLRKRALKRVPKGLFEFVDRGTEEEVSLRNNRAVFDRIRFKPRTLVDVSKRSLETALFGVKHKMPLVIAPTGTAGLMWYEGELALARAAKEAGIPFTLATGSMTAMERVASEVGGELWFQLYMWPDRSLSHQLVKRAKEAGFKSPPDGYTMLMCTATIAAINVVTYGDKPPCHRQRIGADADQPLAHRRRGDGLHHRVVQLRDQLARCFGGQPKLAGIVIER